MQKRNLAGDGKPSVLFGGERAIHWWRAWQRISRSRRRSLPKEIQAVADAKREMINKKEPQILLACVQR
jgi:hypothetical protein